jgi:peptidoglycan/xylan/chitin deacetylase (PgdA/CDA1 family)
MNAQPTPEPLPPDHSLATPLTRRSVLAGLGGAGLALGVAACSSGAPAPAKITPAAAATSGSPSSAPSARPTPSPSDPSGPPAIATTPGPDIVSGPPNRKEVALTFHGQGEPAMARAVMDACAKAGATITVFAVGQWAAAEPALLREFVAAGHEVGNHTWSHGNIGAMTLAEATTEITKAREAIAKAVGTPGWWFRPSQTQTSNALIREAAQAAGYFRCVSYGVDPEDFRDPGAALVRSRTKAKVQPGSIVSLHLGHAGTVTALPGILADLATRDLRAVTMSTLLRG